MLQHFTWQDFLIAACILSVLWYVGVIPILYRKEIKAFFTRGHLTKGKEEPLPHRWQKGVDELANEQAEDDGLMGAPKMPSGMESVAMDDFCFAQPQVGKEEQLGLIPDVLEEIKAFFTVFAHEDGSKQDFLQLLRMLHEKYPKMASGPNLNRINQFILEHAPFHLTEAELDELW